MEFSSKNTLSLGRSLGLELGAFFPHLMTLVAPLSSILFLATGPHPWWLAPIFVIPFVLLTYLDGLPIRVRSDTAISHTDWPYTFLLYILAALHLLTLYLLVRLFAEQDFFSIDMYMVPILIGSSSSFAIITSHELIHRKSLFARQFGRLILCSVLYEHFFTEHLRGHHARVATSADPASARFEETYSDFWKRTVRGQFLSAWNIEISRLRSSGAHIGTRFIKNRLIQGWIVELTIITCIAVFFGFTALIAFVIQAYVAIKGLEAVNYFEHWGLSRQGRRVRACDSWDTDSWCTHYVLTGLSRHADHHIHPSRSYQELEAQVAAPMLPAGYLVMINMVINQNKRFIELATQELKTRKLGPFAADATSGGSAIQASTIDSSQEDGKENPHQDTNKLSEIRKFRIPALVKWMLHNFMFVAGSTLSLVIIHDEVLGSALVKNLGILCAFSLFFVAHGIWNKWMNRSFATCTNVVLLACVGYAGTIVMTS